MALTSGGGGLYDRGPHTELDRRHEHGEASGDPWRPGYVPAACPPDGPPRLLAAEHLAAFRAVAAPLAVSAPLTPDHIDPQPFNPNFQVQTGISDWINVKALGAVGDGVTDDTGPLQAALMVCAARGGGTVFLPYGTYLVSGVLPIPPYTFLMGQSAVSLNLFTTPGQLTRIVAAASWAPAAPTGIITVSSKTPGGWAVNTASCGVRGVMIDGSQNTSTNLSGIYLTGPVYDLHLEDVFIWNAPHDGITAAGFTETGIGPTYAYHHRWRRVTAASSGFIGFNVVNFTDSVFAECLAFSSADKGWEIQNCSNSQWLGCRSEWNTSHNWDITGASGSLVFSGCTSDAGYAVGLNINAATGQTGDGGGIIWTGGKIHGSGLNGGASDYGLHITGSTVPVAITGLNIEATNGSHGAHPATAMAVATSANITIAGCILQGITTAWSWDSAGVLAMRGCLGATGNPGAQTFAKLVDI